MKTNFYYLIITMVLLFEGCSRPSYIQTPTTGDTHPILSKDPVEMDYWYPPTQEELDERRAHQRELDALESQVKNLFMKYADILADEIILENLIRGFGPQLQGMEARISQELEKLELEHQKADSQIEALKKSVQKAESRVESVKVAKKARTFIEDDYRAAIRLFRDKRYLRSIGKFRKVLGALHPPELTDNILFGLASNYFRLKKFPQAARYLERIMDKHRKGEKWLISHAMLAAVYDLQGRSSKAIFLLEKALKLNPNPDLLNLLRRLLNTAQGKDSDVRS